MTGLLKKLGFVAALYVSAIGCSDESTYKIDGGDVTLRKADSLFFVSSPYIREIQKDGDEIIFYISSGIVPNKKLKLYSFIVNGKKGNKQAANYISLTANAQERFDYLINKIDSIDKAIEIEQNNSLIKAIQSTNLQENNSDKEISKDYQGMKSLDRKLMDETYKKSK